MKIFIFLYWSLKVTALILQITNNECLRGNATRISQFLSIFASHDPYFYLSSKKLVWFNILLFCTLGTSFNSVKKYSSPLSGNYKTFSQLSANFVADSKCRANPQNRRKFLNLEDFSFPFIKGTALICQVTLFKS